MNDNDMIVRIAADVTALRRDLNQATNYARSAGASVKRSFQGAGAGASEAAAQVTRMRVAAAANTNSMRGMGGAMQQAGYQVGDFAVQVASGQSAIVALTQQGSQFLGMLGPWGAVVGAAAAVLGGLYIAFSDSGEEAKAAGNDIESLTAALTAIRSASALAIDDLANLRAQFTALSEDARQFELRALSLQIAAGADVAAEAFAKLSETARSTLAEFDFTYTDTVTGVTQNSRDLALQLEQVRNAFLFGTIPAADFEAAILSIAEAYAAFGEAGRAAQLTELLVAWRQARQSVEGATAALAALNGAVAANGAVSGAAATSVSDLAQRQNELAQSVQRETEEMRRKLAVAAESEAVQDLVNRRIEAENALKQAGIDINAQLTQTQRVLVDLVMAETEAQAALNEQLRHGAAARAEHKRLMQEGRALTESLRTPEEELIARQERLRELLGAGAIDWATYTEAMRRAQDEFDQTREGVQVLGRAYDTMAQGITTALTSGENAMDGFRTTAKRMVDGILSDFLRLVVFEPLRQSLFSGLGGLFAPKSIGFRNLGSNPVPGMAPRASGGPVGSGQPYWVGERGPEIYVPRRSGTIIPAATSQALAGGAGGRGGDTYYIDARGADRAGLAALEAQIRSLGGSVRPMAQSAVADARRRGRKV